VESNRGEEVMGLASFLEGERMGWRFASQHTGGSRRVAHRDSGRPDRTAVPYCKRKGTTGGGPGDGPKIFHGPKS
jgi:hypothetical protein